MKNKVLLNVIVLFLWVSFSQITLAQNNKWDYYHDLLRIQDDNTVILQFDTTKFLVYKNKKVYQYILSLDNEIVLKKQLDRAVENQFFIVLDSLKKINPLELNITKKENVEIEVQDGNNYELKLYTKDKAIAFHSYEPETYIKEKFPYYEQRIAFLKVYHFISGIFYDENYNKIKNSDVVYIYLDTTKDIKDNNYNVYFSKTKSPNLTFISKRVNDEIRGKSFIISQKPKIIDMTFFLKYGYKASYNALQNKKLFIIEKQKSKEDEVKLNSVILLYF